MVRRAWVAAGWALAGVASALLGCTRPPGEVPRCGSEASGVEPAAGSGEAAIRADAPAEETGPGPSGPGPSRPGRPGAKEPAAATASSSTGLSEPPAGASSGDPAPAPPAPTPLPTEVVVDGWLAARGVPAAARAQLEDLRSCRELKLGPAGEAALQCTELEMVSGGSQDAPMYRLLSHGRVIVVRAKRVVRLLDVPLTVSQLDKEEMDQEDVVNARLVVTEDGLEATVSDTPPASPRPWVSCAAAERELAARRPGASPFELAWIDFDAALVRRVCLARGSRRWVGGRFRYGPVIRDMW